MIYLLDDFHNIQTVRIPGEQMKLSIATHMASNLLDIHDNVPAIPLPCDRKNVHRVVTINWKGEIKKCRGGIDTDYISQLVEDQQAQLKSTFLSTIRAEFLILNSKNIQAQLKEFRYCHCKVIYIYLLQLYYLS